VGFRARNKSMTDDPLKNVNCNAIEKQLELRTITRH